jgi:RHS repeat-associated protein
VGPNGIITTVAGTGAACDIAQSQSRCGDGGPGTLAGLWGTTGVALGPDGSLYLGDTKNNRVRRIGPALPGLVSGESILPAEDGSEVYVFNGTGRHLRTLDALTAALRHQFGYNSAGLLVSVDDGDGNVTAIERDTAGRLAAVVGPYGQRTTISLDAHGSLASIANPAGETIQLTSTDSGLLTSLTDPRSNTYRFTYDSQGRLIKDEDPAGGSKTLSRSESGTGYTVTVTTALGRASTYQVERLSDTRVRRVVTDPAGVRTETVLGTDGSETTTFADGMRSALQLGPDPRWGMQAPILKSLTQTTPSGLTKTTTSQRVVTLAAPGDLLHPQTQTDTVTINGRTFTSKYDIGPRTITGTSAAARKVVTTLDTKGRVVQKLVTGISSASYAYDSRGRLTTVSQDGGTDVRATSVTYNSTGYVDTITDPLNRTVRFEYDAAGRVKTQTLPDGQVIAATYDANGNATERIPPGQPAHTFAYTPVDVPSAYTPPDVGAGSTSTLASYNVDRQATRITLPTGQAINLGYDSAGRLINATIARGAIGVAYSTTTGHLTGVTGPGGVNLSAAYDGGLRTNETWAGPVTGSVSRGYDSDFRTASQSVNGASTLAFQYDADSLLTRAGDLTLTRSAQNGLLAGTTLSSVTDAWTYNSFGEPTGYSAAHGTNSLMTVQYARDKSGRITQKTETIGGSTDSYAYTYQPSGRLVEIKKNGTVTASYTYDGNGNRLTFTSSSDTISGSYDAQDRLTQYSTTTYTYTSAGHLLSKTVADQTTTYQYDELGNLISTTVPGGTQIGYLVDGQNRRIGKKINGAVVQGFLYVDSLHPAVEMDGSNTVVSRFFYAGGISPAYMIKAGVTYRIISDHLGSPRLVVDVASGQVAQRLDYDVWGDVTNDTSPGFQPFGFAGGLYDRDTRLYHFGARDYDATTGRWTTKDPIGFAGLSTNIYGYVLGDPINNIDPSWLFTIYC